MCPSSTFSFLSCRKLSVDLPPHSNLVAGSPDAGLRHTMYLDKTLSDQQASIRADDMSLPRTVLYTTPAFRQEHWVSGNLVEPEVKSAVHTWDGKPQLRLDHL